MFSAHGHVRVQRVVLEDHRDVALLAAAAVDDLVADDRAAAADLLEARDHAQRRGLAAARRADEDHELAVRDLEREVRDRARAVRIDLLDAVVRDRCHRMLLSPLEAGGRDALDEPALEDEEHDEDRAAPSSRRRRRSGPSRTAAGPGRREISSGSGRTLGVVDHEITGQRNDAPGRQELAGSSTDANTGLDIGTTISQKVFHGRAPSTRAASSICFGRPMKNDVEEVDRERVRDERQELDAYRVAEVVEHVEQRDAIASNGRITSRTIATSTRLRPRHCSRASAYAHIELTIEPADHDDERDDQRRHVELPEVAGRVAC